MSENNEAKWYVIHTYSGYENKVANDLEKMVENRGIGDMIVDIKIPTERVTDPERNKEYDRKLFPGYVLIKMVVTDDTWYVVRNTQGVTGFVGPASKPVPLTDEEVASLGVEKSTVELAYKVGDRVRIVSGPLEGFEGIVDDIDIPNGNVRVVISMLGRETPADMDLEQIVLAD